MSSLATGGGMVFFLPTGVTVIVTAFASAALRVEDINPSPATAAAKYSNPLLKENRFFIKMTPFIIPTYFDAAKVEIVYILAVSLAGAGKINKRSRLGILMEVLHDFAHPW